METINQPPETETINVTTILGSNNITQDSLQTTEDVETEDFNNVKHVGENKDLQNETTAITITKSITEQNKGKTTNIKLQLVDKIYDSDDDDESMDDDVEPMDISIADDDNGINESQKNHNDSEAQQVEAAAQPQTQPQPQNVEDKKYNNVADNDDDGTISNEAKKCKYEQSKETEEDELLKSDNEDDHVEEHKENPTTVLDSISMAQEEELLKSEDEDENDKEKEKDNMQTTEVEVETSEETKPPEVLKTNENETVQEEEVNMQDLEEVKEESYADEFNLEKHQAIETEISSTDKVCLETESSEKSSHQVEEHQQKSENTVINLYDDESQATEKIVTNAHQPKVQENAENHRILYQFDLDDDSSSEDSFHYKKSPPPTQTSENKEPNAADDSSTSQQQQSISITTDNKDVDNNESREPDKEVNEDEVAKQTEISDFPPPQEASPKSNGSFSDNECEIPTFMSPQINSAKSVESLIDTNAGGDEISKYNEISTFQPPQPATAAKSEESCSDEDNYTDEESEAEEKSSKFTDSWNSENISHNEKDYNEKTFVEENSLVENKLLAIGRDPKELNDDNNSLQLPKLNGDHDSKEDQYNETEDMENSNDSNINNNDDTSRLSLSQKSLIDSNITSSSPQQHSPLMLPPAEDTHTEFQEEVDEINSSFGEQENETNNHNDHKTEIESDNESHLKINETSRDYHNGDSEDDAANKSDVSLPPSPPANQNEDEEASRSSLASSASFSTTTSSSQQLVIDHPMDDVKEEKVKPLKITLKRKLSNLSDDGDSMGPKQKQVHLYVENQMPEESQKSQLVNEELKEELHENPKDLQVEENMEIEVNVSQEYHDHTMAEFKQPSSDMALEINEEKPLLVPQEAETADASTFKSLLLQQLEKPLAMPNIAANRNISPLTISPITYAAAPLPTPHLHLQPLVDMQTPTPTPPPPPPPQATGVTKYLCFKCKTGSFDTFAALTEHQATCLVSHSLFPFNQTTIEATTMQPPASTPPPLNSLQNNKSTAFTTKSADFIDLKEIIAPPTQPTVASTKKRFYKCSTCNTFHENWNLFLHIREQHNRHMCLYCVRFFPTAEKLALHLEIKHDLEQNHFNSEEALRKSIPVLEGYALETRFLMCCTCQHIFTENEQFSQHDCTEYIKPCSLCGQKGRHTNQCKAHPDSKRFSKLKKKKEKHTQPLEIMAPPATGPNERTQKDFTVPPITISNHNINPTIISNSNLNCDSGRAEKSLRPPTTINSMHSEDSNSSSNMVIDESCNTKHMPPAHTQTQPHPQINTNFSHMTQPLISSVQLEPDLPPDRQFVDEAIPAPLPPLKLVVPKLKLCVPKEFQKSVDDALSTSDSEEEVEDDEEAEEVQVQEEQEQERENMDNSESLCTPKPSATPELSNTIEPTTTTTQSSLLAESTPANSQDVEIERNSATESATEAGNSQDDAAYESERGNNNKSTIPAPLLDDDDSLDEPNSNLVRIMQEIERTKMDIKRTKKTSHRHNKPFALPRTPTISQSSNRTADHNWSPTPPASPNSRWFTPRRSTISQSGEEQFPKTPQHQQFLLPPPSPVKQMGTPQERRDTIGSDMMDIDETITSQPTQTIYCNQLRPLEKDNLNTSSESIDIKGNNEPMETSQITDNETSVSDVNNTILETEQFHRQPASPVSQEQQEDPEHVERQEAEHVERQEPEHVEQHEPEHVEHENENKDIDIGDVESTKPNTPETPQNMDISLTQSTDNENNERALSLSEHQEEEGEDDTEIDVCDNKDQEENIQITDNDKSLEVENLPPSDGIEVANEDTVTVDLQLDRPLDKYEIIDFVRICLKAAYPLCLYCNHARRIAVNGKRLVLHIIGHHRFTATVDSITGEELLPGTIVTKLKSFLPDLEEHYFNSNSYCTYGDGSFTSPFNERIFECFQCRFVTSTHKELYLHNRKMHLRTAILCFMCRANFFSFSEILCHICPGVPNTVSVFDVKFRCCLCELDNIPSPFRLMVHLRKKHFACDVCLEDCRDQSKLSSHVWKHKLHHLCYRCGIAYRNKLDITKHLFWKHGTESTICKRCLQKRWRHVYHFCIPPTTFACEVCNLCFSKAMYLRVHKRLHSGDLRYPCIEDSCEEKFISRKLLLKHALLHQILPPEDIADKEKNAAASLENKENEFGGTKDTVRDDLKMTTDLQNIKQELVEIKKEPLDESEMECQNLLKQEKSEMPDKKEPENEKVKKSGVGKDSKNGEIKEKKHSVLNEPRKKRKKSKRSKELLEDLNLTAPNLSESDSSDDSDSDSDSKTKSEIDAMPRVMLSPPSEAENDDKENKSSEPVEPGQVLDIWKNFLKTQQGSSSVEELERLKASNELNKQPKPKPVHVACSDHDYCKMEEPEPPAPPPAPKPVAANIKDDFKKPSTDVTSTPETSPTKRKQSKSPRRRLSSKRSDASSSSSGSSSSSDSSCSCGSNCSCSSSDSDSSSSSSSSDDSDSSMASNNSVRKRHRKKSERDRMRKRSESISPLKQHKLSVSISEVINVDDDETVKEAEKVVERPPSPPKEPLFYESDLETNESETDEEFYDEHPQKLANELLAQKRAQLMAQTRLSPSHNYDIVENSRPSTPSLPEEVATNEKPKIKVKKKKRDRKSSCKGQGVHSNHVSAPEQAIAPAQTVLEVHQPPNTMMQVVQQQPPPPPTATLINPVIDSQLTQPTHLYTTPQNIMPQTIYAPPPPMGLTEHTTLTPRPLTMPPYGNSHRMSEGSSCSDADGSLKRSKRQRRPNKFYGYTSDDENHMNGPPLMIGTRAFKPQPPPQLTWCKDDLPTPSKSILNNKNKTPRTPKTPATPGSPIVSTFSTSTSKKKSKLSLTGGEKSARKRPAKKKDAKIDNKFPPIPTLKIRPSQIGLNTTINHSTTKPGNYNTTDDTSSDDDTAKGHGHFAASSSFNASMANQTLAAALPPPIILPSQPPAPPTPQTTAFNHRIPPALLPNPDFATLQYFKANNIRYPIRPPAGARQARDGESVYCYCRCPYDEVSEMIACDGENCLIEWFHFECVGIMVAPQGKWFCAECRPKYSEELYPSSSTGHLNNV